MKKRYILIGALTGVLALPALALAQGAVVDNDPLVTEGSADVQLVRTNGALSISGTVHGLNPHETFTVWWIWFDGDDFVVMNATGGLSTNAGDFSFGAGVGVGDYPLDSVPREVLVPGSLNDPHNAFVILHVLGHGPPGGPGVIPEQISEFLGGGGFTFQAEIIFIP